MVCLAIQMGRPTKYTSPAASVGVSGTAENCSSSSTTHLGFVITPWYQAASAQSLLRQQLHHSLHAADAINPWLMTSPDVSLSPDSTVKELEQSSSDNEDVKMRQHDPDEAVNLCQKSVASSVALTVHQIPSRMSQWCTASISTSSVSVASANNVTLQTQAARRWLNSDCSNISSDVHNSTRHTALNLSLKPRELCDQNSSSHRAITVMPFSEKDNDNDSSGCFVLLLFWHTSCYW